MKNQLRVSRWILIFFFSISFLRVSADNYFWVGGTGSWGDYVHHWAISSGGQLYHNHVPTPNDTVIFDSLSFIAPNDSVFADSAILYCYTMKWEHVQFHPVFSNHSNLSNCILKIFGSLQLDTGMTFAFGGTIRMSTLDSGQTILSRGQQFVRMEISGDSTGEIGLLDTLRSNTLLFSTGTFYSNGQTIYAPVFYQGYINRTVIDLDTSTIFTNLIRVRHAPQQFIADSSTFIITNADTLVGGGLHYGKINVSSTIVITGDNQFETAEFYRNVEIYGSNIFGIFNWMGRGAILTLMAGSTQTIIDTLIFNGSCAGLSAIESSHMGTPATIFKTSGTINCDRILLEDIITGGSASFVANNAVLNGNCTGWTATASPTPRTLFWVGDSGSWSDTAHWSLSSGGTGGECAPDPLDNVVFDSLSFTTAGAAVLADLSLVICDDMNWSTATGVPNFFQNNTQLECYGSLAFATAMNYNSGKVRMRTSQTGKLITPSGKYFNDLTFYGNGNWQLAGALDAGALQFRNGSFNSVANPINASWIFGGFDFSFSYLLGGSVVSAGSWMMMNASAGFVAPAVITTSSFSDMNNDNYNQVIFPSDGWISGICSISNAVMNGNAQIYGIHTFDSLYFTRAGSLIQLEHGMTQTVGTLLNITSSCSEITTLQSTLAGDAAMISKASGTISVNDIILEDITAMGGANFVGTNTIATYNVNGWNITPPPGGPMYWIGGSGNWNDPNHWSLSSGGSPGTCVPNPLNDVFFDTHSFIGNADSVKINIEHAYCKSMDWTGSTGSPKLLSLATQNTLRCYGSMLLDQNVSANQGVILFRSHTAGETINTNGQPLGFVRFDGFNGSWQLQADLQADSIEIINGTLQTSGKQINTVVFRSDSASTRGLQLDSSVVFAVNWIVQNDSAFTLDATQAHLIISGSDFTGGENRYYHAVTFTDAVTIWDADTFGIARFTNMGHVKKSCVYDTLFLDNPGYAISFESGTTQLLNGKLLSSGTSSQAVGMESSDMSATVSMVKLQDTICTEFLVLRGMTATGGAVFYAGYYSSDAGNNSGWTFQDCTPAMIDVWPGDANRDLVDDNLDLLAIGVAFGHTHSPRSNASNTWVAQPSWVWEVLFANGSDIVNADCDGDGTIGYSDTTAVILNYSLTHPARYGPADSTLVSGLPLYFNTPLLPPMAGDTVSISIMLGNAIDPALNVYGIAFTLHYNSNNVVPGSAWLDFTNSWLAPVGYEIHILKHFPAQNKMDIAISRIDHQNFSGQGEIARLHFRLDPGAQGMFKCWYTDVTLIDYNEIEYPVQVTMGSFQIAVGIDEITQQGFHAYPNPTNGTYIIDDAKLSGENSVIEISDMAGRIVQQTKSEGESSVTLNLSELPAGTYFVRMINERGTFVERVVRQ